MMLQCANDSEHKMPKKKNIGKINEVYNIILYHIIVYKAKLTRKPSKAPAMTSTSVWPIDSFREIKFSLVLSIPSSILAAEPEDNTAWLFCLILSSDLSNKGEFVDFDVKELASSDTRGPSLSKLTGNDVPGWESIIFSLSLVWTELTCILASTLFRTFAWFPTSLLTPCRSKINTQIDVSVWL